MLENLRYLHKSGWFNVHGVDPLSMHEAPLFLRHAARVRFLHLSPSYACDQYFHLLNVFIGTHVFPKLLVLDCRELRDTRILHLFLSPTLRRCNLPVSHSNLKSIETCCPVLESLSIHTGSCSTDELSLLSGTVRSCKRLVDLRCFQLDFAAWKHLANLATLLTVNIQEAWCASYQPLGWDHLYFARFLNLTTLIFDVEESADVITILQHSEFPSLKIFRMDVFVLPWTMTEQLFCALSSCKGSDTLECIDIASDSESPVAELSNIPMLVIKQFLPFHRLQTLSLHLHHGIYLDNDLLLEVMSSWPDIRELEITGMRDLDDYSQHPVTFRGLSVALPMCPRLHSLQLSMDATNIDIDIGAESFQHTSLEWLYLVSDVQDPYAVARIIFSMFPSIKKVEGYDESPWFEVNRYLKDFATHGRCIEEEPSPMT